MIDPPKLFLVRSLAADRPFTAVELAFGRKLETETLDSFLAFHLLLAGLNSDESPDRDQLYVVEKLIEALQKQQDCALEQMVAIEWGYLPIIDRHSSSLQPKTLEAAIYHEPGFFVTVLEARYLDENAPPLTKPRSDADRHRAERARMFLENLSVVPGTSADGVIDFKATNEWVAKVRQLAKEKGRSKYCDFEIGRLLLNAPKDDSGKPDKELASIIEKAKSESMLDGYANAILNGRGITSRSPFDGGKQERELVAKYSAISNAFAGTHPNFSEMYSRIARSYESQARQEDLAAERERLGR